MKSIKRHLAFTHIIPSSSSSSSFLHQRHDKLLASPSANVCTTRTYATCTLHEAIASPLQFPILSQKVNDKPLVYLDSAATSQKPQSVIDAITQYYTQTNSNVHRGAHTLASKSTQQFEETRTSISKFINCEKVEEVIYTRNATEAINLVASTWGRQHLNKDDIILVSVMEHHANLVPWQMTGCKVIPVPLNDHTQTYGIDHLKRLLDEHGSKVKLIACSHVSNVLGCINPINEIIELAHSNGSLVCLDACQSLPHMNVNVQELDVDFLVGSAHKMLGPTGVGFLYAKYKILESIPPFMGGGEMIQDVYIDKSTYALPPHKFEAGTPAIGEVVAFSKAIQYLQNLGMHKIHQHDISLGKYLYDQLSQFNEITIYGPAENRVGLCSFNVQGVHSGDLATMLDLEGIAVRSGHHCAQPLHRELGINSSVRASLYIYNSTADIDTFIIALIEACSLLGVKISSTEM